MGKLRGATPRWTPEDREALMALHSQLIESGLWEQAGRKGQRWETLAGAVSLKLGRVLTANAVRHQYEVTLAGQADPTNTEDKMRADLAVVLTELRQLQREVSSMAAFIYDVWGDDEID